MSKQDNKHIGTFRRDKLMPDETLEADLKGWLDKKSDRDGLIQHNGQFVLTNKRACFYSKAPFEEIFETIPLSKITSVETSSLMGYRVLRVHTAHDDLEFKTLEPKALFDNVVACFRREDSHWRITHMHNSVPFAMDGSGRALLNLKP